jgi:TolA-binding protein
VQTDTPVSATASASAPSTLQVATAAVTGPSRASPGPTTSSSPRAEADASPGPRRDADTLYQEAHDAHFRDGDYARAAELWDRYLRAGGPLAPEARYNRGVALLRTGQRDEARKVLQPFADGEYGNYRRREAESLLRSLP